MPDDLIPIAGSLAGKTREVRDGFLAEAAEVLARSRQAGRAKLTTVEFDEFSDLVDRAAEYDEAHTLSAKVAEEQRSGWKVISEPRTYGPGQPASFFADLSTSASSWHPDQPAAAERIRRHGAEVATEVRRRSPEGWRALRCAQELTRGVLSREQADREAREMTTNPSSAGAFATPQYLLDETALYRSAPPVFASQCQQVELPAWGMEVLVPNFTGPGGVAPQTEGFGVDEVIPTSGYLTGTVQTLAGQVPVSQQLLDRGGMPGATFDRFVLAQLTEQLAQQADDSALLGALANAPTVTDSSAFSFGDLLADLSAGREKLADAAGTKLRATHVFTTSDLWGHVSSLTTSGGQAVVDPAWTAQPWATYAASGDPRGEGWTGYMAPAGMAWFTDDNIPTTNSGADTQILVARPDTVLLLTGEPTAAVYPETLATTLSAEVTFRQYVAVIPKYAAGVCAISGSAYPITLT